MKRPVLGLLLLLALALPCAARAQGAADPFAPLVAALGGSFAQQAEAVERLGASGDPRALPILRALSEGRLQKLPDGTVLAPGAEAPGAEPIRINNRVRAALRGALGRLQLVSPDPAERLAAAEAVFRSRSAESVPLLEAALARSRATSGGEETHH